MRKIFVLFIILVSFSVLMAESTVFSECSVRSENGYILIRWTSNDENGIDHYRILRSSSQSQYLEIAVVKARGSGSSYQYADRQVMVQDASSLFYRIEALDANGNVVEQNELIVFRVSSTDLTRSWGTIKALFR